MTWLLRKTPWHRLPFFGAIGWNVWAWGVCIPLGKSRVVLLALVKREHTSA